MSAPHRNPRSVRRVRAAFLAASVSIVAVTGAAWASPAHADGVPTFNPFQSGSAIPNQPLRPAPKTLEQPLPLQTYQWGPRFQAPKVTCYEDMPCWRVWMGNGTFGPNAPAYMFLPESVTDPAVLEAFGYRED